MVMVHTYVQCGSICCKCSTTEKGERRGREGTSSDVEDLYNSENMHIATSWEAMGLDKCSFVIHETTHKNSKV